MLKSIVGENKVNTLIKNKLLNGSDDSNIKWLAYANNNFYYVPVSDGSKLLKLDNVTLTDEEVQKVMVEIHELTDKKRVKKNRTILINQDHHIIHSSNYDGRFKSHKELNKLVIKTTGRLIDKGSVTLEVWYNVYSELVNSDFKTS